MMPGKPRIPNPASGSERNAYCCTLMHTHA